jgi:hypothetical protein
MGSPFNQGADRRFPAARFADTLNEDTRLDLVAYVLQLNGAPAGTDALTRDTDVEIGRLTGEAR